LKRTALHQCKPLLLFLLLMPDLAAIVMVDHVQLNVQLKHHLQTELVETVPTPLMGPQFSAKPRRLSHGM
jgi:hypothetical protein